MRNKMLLLRYACFRIFEKSTREAIYSYDLYIHMIKILMKKISNNM